MSRRHNTAADLENYPTPLSRHHRCDGPQDDSLVVHDVAAFLARSTIASVDKPEPAQAASLYLIRGELADAQESSGSVPAALQELGHHLMVAEAPELPFAQEA